MACAWSCGLAVRRVGLGDAVSCCAGAWGGGASRARLDSLVCVSLCRVRAPRRAAAGGGVRRQSLPARARGGLAWGGALERGGRPGPVRSDAIGTTK